MDKWEIEDYIEKLNTEKVKVELIDNDLILSGENWRISLDLKRIKSIETAKVIHGFRAVLTNETIISWGREGKLWISW